MASFFGLASRAADESVSACAYRNLAKPTTAIHDGYPPEKLLNQGWIQLSAEMALDLGTENRSTIN